jgi:hypothetical protein
VPTLDDDDEIAFMASDAGAQAPTGILAPLGTSDGQAVTVVDPLDPSHPKFVYLYRKAGGSAFTAANGYVTYTRDANADEVGRSLFDRARRSEVLGRQQHRLRPQPLGQRLPHGRLARLSARPRRHAARIDRPVRA